MENIDEKPWTMSTIPSRIYRRLDELAAAYDAAERSLGFDDKLTQQICADYHALHSEWGLC